MKDAKDLTRYVTGRAAEIAKLISGGDKIRRGRVQWELFAAPASPRPGELNPRRATY